MVATSALDIVSAYQDAWTSRDFDTAARYVADDIVFRSPQQHITGAREFLSMLRGFAARVAPRWEQVSAASSEESVLLLYNLFSDAGDALPCADYFTLRDGRIATETLVFDPRPFAELAQRRQPG